MPIEQQSINAETMQQLNELLKSVDLSDVTADSTGYDAIEDGYFLSKVDSMKLTVSKKGNMQVAMQLSIVDFGYKEDETNTSSEPKVVQIKKSYKNRKIYKYYPLTDVSAVKRFANDMLKFEDKPGHSILPKEAFLQADIMEEAIQMIVDMQIYVMVSNDLDDDGKVKNTWYNLISWTRADKFGLPVED